MKDGFGWKPSEAVGQAIMFSRRKDAGRGDLGCEEKSSAAGRG